MKITILQENLLRALTRANRIVPVKPQLPVVANVLFSTEEGRVKITATNLETTEVVRVGAKVEKDGGICVSSRLFLELVSTLPHSAIVLTLQDGALQVDAQGYRASIPGLPASEFPAVARCGEKPTVLLKKTDTIGAVSQVVFAAATDEGRPILTGVRVLQQDGETLFVATDGFRLSVKKLPLKTKEELNFLVPARALDEVVKVCLEEKDAGEVSLTKLPSNQLVFGVGDTDIQTRLIDGEFPNFEKIIPLKHNTRALFDKQTLMKAVKSAAIFARDNANIIRFHIENQTVVVSANTPNIGENQIEVEAKVDGEGGDTAINSRFLIDCLANFPGEELLFEMTGSLNPAVFKPARDDSYLHIIMPVRVQG